MVLAAARLMSRPRKPSCAAVLWVILLGWALAGWAAAAPKPEPDAVSPPAPAATEAGSKTLPSASKPRAAADQDGAGEVVPGKVRRYALRLLKRYDRNEDGSLQPEEWGRMPPGVQAADANHDQIITLDELVAYMTQYARSRSLRLAPVGMGAGKVRPGGVPQEAGPGQKQARTDEKAAASPEESEAMGPGDNALDPAVLDALERDRKFHVPAGRLPAGLPNWFTLRDEDGDGQLTLSEFAPKAKASDIEEFRRYDLNGDGVITAEECVRAMKRLKASGGGAGSKAK
jgi:hypothetical protein